ncbi:MAG: calcium/sodium antiporter [Alphaproteobacteria bacterium]|nr:calcium/sodium antiporter [Alphaproteobacteria bacterium]
MGFILLVRGADVFVDGSVAIARRWHIPEIIIGLTVVAMGTSAPEAAVSITSAFQGANGVAIGNVFGSNIANIFLVLGLTSIISALSVGRNTTHYEIPFVGFITLLLMWMGWQYGMISHACAALLCLLFVLFLVYLFAVSDGETGDDMPTEKHMSIVKTLLFIVGGIAALVIGSDITVNSAVKIAQTLNVSDRVIGLTIVALGTSLPELVTCIVAALKHQSGIAIGNIVGSNIFNILFVLGIAGLVHTIPFDAAFIADGAIAMLAVVALFAATARTGRLGRVAGILFVAIYFGYICSVIM